MNRYKSPEMEGRLLIPGPRAQRGMYPFSCQTLGRRPDRKRPTRSPPFARYQERAGSVKEPRRNNFPNSPLPGLAMVRSESNFAIWSSVQRTASPQSRATLWVREYRILFQSEGLRHDIFRWYRVGCTVYRTLYLALAAFSTQYSILSTPRGHTCVER